MGVWPNIARAREAAGAVFKYDYGPESGAVAVELPRAGI
jgi:hypothetical protein